jgi:hypothetical protein
MVTNFCRDSGDGEDCRSGYMWTMTILLILYMPIDIVLYLVVKKTYEERDPNTAVKAGNDFGMELKTHNMA